MTFIILFMFDFYFSFYDFTIFGRWYKREHDKANALNTLKLNISILDLLPPESKFTFRNLKKGIIQEFHRKLVLAHVDKVA